MSNTYYVDRVRKQIVYTDQEFQHHGVLGQRWGVITKNVGVNYVPIGRRSNNVSGGNLLLYWQLHKLNEAIKQQRLDRSRAKDTTDDGNNRKLNMWSPEGKDGTHILTKASRIDQMKDRVVSTGVRAWLLAFNTALIHTYGPTPILIAREIGSVAFLGANLFDNAKKFVGTKEDDARRKTLPIDEETGFHLRIDKDPASKDIDKVNPGKRFLTGDYNCPGCAMATELRQRGYDVRAKDFDGIVATKSMLNGFFPKDNRTVEYIHNAPVYSKEYNLSKMGGNKACYEETMKYLSSQPNGSRGFLFIKYGTGGGHVTNYFVENGKAKIYEGQLGRRYSNFDTSDFLRNCYSTSFVRVDDLPINAEICKEVVV